jgi:hypothetical protein
VAVRSKMLVCGLSLAGIVGSNLVGGMDVCVVTIACCQVEASVWADHSSVRVLPYVVCVNERDRAASIKKWP